MSSFLFELGTEELPPKSLINLSKNLEKNFIELLKNSNLSFDNVERIATPRRLGILIKGLQLEQNDELIEKKGPAVNAPEQAIIGFAKSCGIVKEKLIIKSLKNKEYYYAVQHKKGKKTLELLPEIITNSVMNLSIAKGMRWGNSDKIFVRPIKWIVALLDTEVIKVELFDLSSDRVSRGLRFVDDSLKINSADNYYDILQKANIEVNFAKRKSLITYQIKKVAKDNQAIVVIDDELLDEVCALVEYPNAFLGKFDESFLSMPKEVLILVMKSHQKYFHCENNKGDLLPFFISVANLKSKKISSIIRGNEKVINPRLRDAMFFLEQDKKQKLKNKLKTLENVVFMQGLGSVADKVKRNITLAEHMTKFINVDKTIVVTATEIMKSDLATDMVGEFSDLQGVMGAYYAKNEGYHQSVCDCILTQYNPRFADDTLPISLEAIIVSMADKLDSIVKIFANGNEPTGSKDPFSLRRQALGIVRMIIEKKINFNIKELIEFALKTEKPSFDNQKVIPIYNFILDRLRSYFLDKGFSNNLIEVNKRIKNILAKANNISELDSSILVEVAEIDLFKAIENIDNNKNIIDSWLMLKPLIDAFFDNVMVNVDDEKLKMNRLALLKKVRALFLTLGDISYLA